MIQVERLILKVANELKKALTDEDELIKQYVQIKKKKEPCDENTVSEDNGSSI